MTSKNNIAYTNIRCQAVANEVRKRLNKKNKYELGEILICRVYKKDEEGKLNVNIRWEVVEVEGRNVTIQDIKSKGQEPLMKILQTNILGMLTVQIATADKEQQKKTT